MKIINSTPTLDVRNVSELPRAGGAKFLLCIESHESGVLIAKRWCRKELAELAEGEVLVRLAAKEVS